MAAAHCHDRTDRIAVRLEVPRDAAGDLQAGVRGKLDRVAGVDVVAVDITGLRPRLNDLTVDADVEVTFADDVDAADLTDTVGVHDAHRR